MIGMEDHGEANADLTPVEPLQVLFKQVTVGPSLEGGQSHFYIRADLRPARVPVYDRRSRPGNRRTLQPGMSGKIKKDGTL